MQAEIDINKLFTESIIEGLRNTLGESCMQAVLHRLNLAKHADKPSDFHASLYSIFNQGAIVLEKMIVKELYRRLNMVYEERDDFNLEESVNVAKRIVMMKILVP
ncbi:MAG: hypothetical protein HYU39_01475 [Thaumarchaeota archaeon]|nr:hypothetical protein [Nitrososphaerota archaeon]